MPRYFVFFILLLFISACGDAENFSASQNFSDFVPPDDSNFQHPYTPPTAPPTSDTPDENNTALTLESLIFQQSDYEHNLEDGIFTPRLRALLSDGRILEQMLPVDLQKNLDCSLKFFSSNERVAKMSTTGWVVSLKEGVTNLHVQCNRVEANAVLMVMKKTLPSNSPASSSTTSSSVPSSTHPASPPPPSAGKPACNVNENFSPEQVKSVQITMDVSNWVVGKTRALSATIELDTGTLAGISGKFVTPLGSLCELAWSSSNPNSLNLSGDMAQLKTYARPVLYAAIQGVFDQKTVQPFMPTAGYDANESFLGQDDVATWINIGQFAGFGMHLFPDVINDAPRFGGTDVVSFGAGGILKIELHGYLVADGPGPDFTIFENPFSFVDNQGHTRIYQEPARIGVSQDDHTYYYFDCAKDPKSGNYTGCAGLTPVNFNGVDEKSFLDPKNSGGDSFDLAEFKLGWIRYIRIEDISRVQDLDPLFSANGKAGFDLDAIGIVNGLEEGNLKQYVP